MSDHGNDDHPTSGGHYATTNPPMALSQELYLNRVLQLGALEGPHDHQDLMPELLPLLEAAHHVLAGGEVSVNVERRGNPDIMRELGEMRAKVVEDSNHINAATGLHFVGGI